MRRGLTLACLFVMVAAVFFSAGYYVRMYIGEREFLSIQNDSFISTSFDKAMLMAKFLNYVDDNELGKMSKEMEGQLTFEAFRTASYLRGPYRPLLSKQDKVTYLEYATTIKACSDRRKLPKASQCMQEVLAKLADNNN